MERKKREPHLVDEIAIRENCGEENRTKLIFALRLNQLLESNQISQEELAKKAQISTGVISKYRNGISEPKATIIVSLSKALDVSSDYLLGITDVKSSDIDDVMINQKLGLGDVAISQLTSFKEVNQFSIEQTPTIDLNTIMETPYFYNLLTEVSQIPSVIAEKMYVGIEEDTKIAKIKRENYFKMAYEHFEFMKWKIAVEFMKLANDITSRYLKANNNKLRIYDEEINVEEFAKMLEKRF